MNCINYKEKKDTPFGHYCIEGLLADMRYHPCIKELGMECLKYRDEKKEE